MIKRQIENIQTHAANYNIDELRDYLKSNFLITLNTNRMSLLSKLSLSSNLGNKMGEDSILLFHLMTLDSHTIYLTNKIKDKEMGLMGR